MSGTVGDAAENSASVLEVLAAVDKIIRDNITSAISLGFELGIEYNRALRNQEVEKMVLKKGDEQ